MSPQRHEPIAVIGSGCRFPGEADSPAKLWELLHNPRDVLKEIPPDRFNPDAFYHPDGLHHGSSNVKSSYLLEEDHRRFDAQFFNIKPVEANSIDPQQRLLLEAVYEAVEAAGLTIDALRGSKTGVYVGLMCEEYSDMLLRDVDSLPTYFGTGTARSIMSNRVSYFFDWCGPSMTIDTACSSSLVAVHQAVQLLRSGDSRVAVAAGANLILGPEPYIAESKLKMLSPGSRSRMWDADADGYARGEGVAAVVLKTLSAALEDNDHIECIIRETGVSQDGRTKGITMPSAQAQSALIRDTYAKAGLEINNKHDRCQYFEAHGTGTPAGDPVEAEAISQAFSDDRLGFDAGNVLYVGSVKTIIGHTEGTAGIAGLLKVSLALQHSIIPPNMLFRHLNPAIEPFYGKLQIPTTAQVWPHLPAGTPRRASVNSFGFGGTNAHAILESYETDEAPNKVAHTSAFTPFVFSATSEMSLAATIARYSAYLKANPSTNLRDLAWTLHSRRSAFPVRASFPGLTVESLCSNLDAAIETTRGVLNASIGTRSTSSSTRILGVFTGQGAQWALMGRELILNSDFVRETIESLESVLADLPTSDRPSWSLKDELLTEASSSRLGEATLSQPLCTAIQIVLVDLLRNANINFDAVVGHSSGEIAAAYAANFISSRDAILIAYYRGFYAKLACGHNQRKGAMLAVGTSPEDAEDFCALPKFKGYISVAACNASSSVTLSGDADAIGQAKDVFEDEKKFARLLKVDKAYHSHHMAPCSEPYLQSLRACNIRIQRPSKPSCSWFSSVYEGKLMEACEELRDVYWVKNMTQPVLFSQAVTNAFIESVQFGVALEIGPHPALKGPATQTIQDVTTEVIPYSGLLTRGVNDVAAFANALGFVWTYLGKSVVDFNNYDRSFYDDRRPRLLKDLPRYAWDHDRIFWHESRTSRLFCTRKEPVHELLGTRSSDSAEGEIRWRNLLRPSEVPWLNGHQLQGQTVFPAAGYAVTALEAAMVLAGERSVQLIEIQDLVIGRPMTFDDDTSGVETLFTLSTIMAEQTSRDVLLTSFRYYCSANKESDSLVMIASGRISVLLGEPSHVHLPYRAEMAPDMVDVDVDRFYSSLNDLGYGYSGPFRALTSMKRKMSMGRGLVAKPPSSNEGKALLVHPAMLDAAFQSIFLGYCWPGDGRLWSLHVPTSVHRITVNPSLCYPHTNQEILLPFDSTLGDSTDLAIQGDVDIYPKDGQNAMIQIEGVSIVPFAPASAADDCQMFSHMVWDVAFPDAGMFAEKNRAPADEIELATLLERVSYFYLRNLDRQVTPGELERSEWHHKKLFDYAHHIFSLVESGKQPFGKMEWMQDTHDQIVAMMNEYPDSIELRLMRAVGENLPAAVKGETIIIEHMMKDGMLNEYYVQSLGLKQYTSFFAQTAAQIVHRYPHMNILEIGAGTGGATKSILKKLGQTFSSYTFTDISTGFFETAREVFKEYANRMIFKAFDAEKDVVAQGYVEQSYDLVIASLVLHATSKLEYTMKNVRRLLKPGGLLLMLEVTSNGPMRMGFTMGGLAGWWLGGDDGRPLSPCISSVQWDSLLRKTGFSGVDTITPEVDILPRPFSVIVSQAVDDHINVLRQPLQIASIDSQIHELVIIGGKTLQTAKLADDFSRLLTPHCGLITRADSLEDPRISAISPMSTVASFTELDQPIFKSLTSEKLDGLRRLFDQSRNVLWVTQGCRADEPYANMTVGFGRALVLEMPHVRLQCFDIDSLGRPDPQMFAEALLRLQIADSFEKQGLQNGLLWSTEPELALEDGRVFVPRILFNKGQNDRYNSQRRSITHEVSPTSSTVKVELQRTSYVLREDSRASASPETDIPSSVTVKVTYSLLSPVQITSTASLFVVIGTNIKTGQTILALSESNASFVDVPNNWLISCDIPVDQEGQYLQSLSYELLTQFMVAITPSKKTILVHEPRPLLASVLSRRAEEKCIRVVYTTSESQLKDSGWISVHPRATGRVIKAMLPGGISTFVDLSANAESDSVGSHIAVCLSQTCKVLSCASRYGRESVVDHREDSFIDLLRSASQSSITAIHEAKGSSTVDTVGLKAVLDNTTENSIVDWTQAPTVPVQIKPVDSENMLRGDRTYLLVGLAGGLGLSLCQWMVGSGARYVVMTSRSPKIDKRWLHTLEATGATIKVVSSDITDKEALQKLYSEVCSTLPPIAGVANGAMVLQDTPVMSMSLEAMTKVLKPKVDGSQHLNELFQENTLDFFIFFSSLACVFGNSGQSNYAAANAFMISLAAQRRKRGLAASVIDIGAIMGIGYMAREVSQSVLDQLRKAGYMWMSERDFQLAFAEAILAGRPDSGANPELITGLRVVDADEELKTPWFSNPKFQHCIMRQQGREDGNKGNMDPAVLIRNQLVVAASREEVYEILRDSFVSKLQIVLQLRTDGVNDEKPILEQGADELGIDSLVAVEIRSWFLKELDVDMPVLKILGGSSVEEMLEYTLEKLPKALTPNLTPSLESGTPSAAGVEVPQASDPTAQNGSPRSLSTSEPSNAGSSSESKGTLDTSSSTVSVSDGKEVEFSEPSSAPERTEKMSFGQSRFWFLKLYLEDQTTFNITCSIHLTGNLRLHDFENAVKTVGQSHEALRTCFFTDKSQQPRQGILKTSVLHLERKDVVNEEDVAYEFAQMNQYVFDLKRGETMRIVLLSQSATSHSIIIGYHHIVMDGVSLQILISDLERAYNRQPLSHKVCQYPKFSSRQREQFESGSMQDDILFWRKKFLDFPPPLSLLPFGQASSRRPLTEYDSTRVDFRISSSLAARIKDSCRKHKVTPFHFYLACFQTMLFRFLGDDDLCIGMADANRGDSDVLGSIGLFLNLLPLRFRSKPTQSFSDALKEARSEVYGALGHSRLPFDTLLHELNVPRSEAHSPLFQTFIDYRHGVQDQRPFGNCHVQGQKYEVGRSAYDISLDIIDNIEGNALVLFMVQKSLYDVRDAELLMKSYVNLLEAFSTRPTSRLDQQSLYNKADVDEAMKIGKGPSLRSQWPPTLLHRLEEVVRNHGSNTAVKDGRRNVLSYKQMDDRINSIAASMLAADVKVGSKVAVFQEPTSDWVCSVLAILRIGAVYVPLDLRIPLIRLADIVYDCQPHAILSHAPTTKNISALMTDAARIINVSTVPESTSVSIPTMACTDSPAAILYTSGSTGTPKGTILKHSSLSNQMEVYAAKLRFGSETVLQQTACSFDMSLWQLFMAISNGGAVYVVSKDMRGDSRALTEVISAEHITLTCATPSEYVAWLLYGITERMQCSEWRIAFSGGEPISDVLTHELRALNKSQLRLINCYGPTEITCSSNSFEVPYQSESFHLKPLQDRAPAGYTLPNYAVYILDEHMRPVPAGIPGEIAIGGAGVASGYLNNEELTRSKFLPDTFADAEYLSKGWTTMHLTGDRGRLQSDGALLCYGRVDGDTQIKLRGIRIDLNDISSSLIRSANGVLANASISVRGTLDQFLVAYVVFAQNRTPSDPTLYLRTLLSRLPLPSYMRPALAMPLDDLPMTVNGKLDRKALDSLPLPRIQQSGQERPLTITEQRLRRVWTTVLTETGSSLEISKDSDFFSVGGNSLLLLQLQSKISDTFGVHPSLMELFQSNTLESMASRLIVGSASESSQIDWDYETQFAPEFLDFPPASNVVALKAGAKVVVLTGATGFLGQAILRSLLESSTVEKIHCIAVRRNHDRKHSISSSKVVMHSGDLRVPRLGLSKKDAANIFEEADVIIHNGAEVSFLKTYHTLKRANVDSTKELIKLSLARRIPIHYISTTGIGHMTNKDTFEEASASAYKPPADGSNGYTATKWASERCLENMNEQIGLPIWLHRPSSITGEDAPAFDIMHNLLKYSRLMQAVPVSDRWHGSLDFISVEAVASGVISEVLSSGSAEIESLKYLHHSGELVVPVAGMQAFLEEESGSTFTALPLDKWAERAVEFGLDVVVAGYLRTLKGSITFPRLRRNAAVIAS